MKSPRPYQEAAITHTVELLLAGRRPCLVSPTGSGKSFMSNSIIERVKAVEPGHWLALVHTRVLREQSKATVPAASGVSTLQSLVSPGRAGDYRREKLKGVRGAWADECHHIVATEFMKAAELLKQAFFFGATATPQRADGTPLGDAFTDIVVAEKYSNLVEQGFLCPCDIAKPELSRKEQLKRKVRVDGVASYMKHGLTSDGKPRPGIYFDTTISDCLEAARRFNELGIRAKVVSCEVQGAERQAIFDAYTAGALDMLCSPQALAEGFDSPRAEVCVLRRTCGSPAMYIQMVGRILRPYPGKERSLLIDCTDAASIHGKPTANRVYSLEGDAITEEQAEEAKEALERELAAREAFKEIQVRYEIIRDRLREVHSELLERNEGDKHATWDEFNSITGLKPPLIIKAKYAGKCKACLQAVPKGDQVFWNTAGMFHTDCWFGTLNESRIASTRLFKESEHV